MSDAQMAMFAISRLISKRIRLDRLQREDPRGIDAMIAAGEVDDEELEVLFRLQMLSCRDAKHARGSLWSRVRAALRGIKA